MSRPNVLPRYCSGTVCSVQLVVRGAQNSGVRESFSGPGPVSRSSEILPERLQRRGAQVVPFLWPSKWWWSIVVGVPLPCSVRASAVNWLRARGTGGNSPGSVSHASVQANPFRKLSEPQQKLMSSFSPKMTSKVNNYSLTQSDWCWWAAIIIKANSSNNNNLNQDDQVREPLPHRGASRGKIVRSC